MCKCKRFGDGTDIVGGGYGMSEYHNDDGCARTDTRTLRQRIFFPLSRICLKLAGDGKSTPKTTILG